VAVSGPSSLASNRCDIISSLPTFAASGSHPLQTETSAVCMHKSEILPAQRIDPAVRVYSQILKCIELYVLSGRSDAPHCSAGAPESSSCPCRANDVVVASTREGPPWNRRLRLQPITRCYSLLLASVENTLSTESSGEACRQPRESL